MPRVLRFLQTGLRKKTRVAFAVALAVFAATALHTFTRPKIYEATASVDQRHPQDVLNSDSGRILGEGGRCGDMSLARRVAESTLITKRVSDHLLPNDLHAWAKTPANDLLEELTSKRAIQTNSSSCLLSFTIRDADRFHAARLANLFAEELAAFESRYTLCREPSIEQVDRMVEQQRAQVVSLEEKFTTVNESERPALHRELEINRYHLAAMLHQKETMPIEQSLREAARPRIIPAEVPDSPVSPHIPFRLAAGLLAGLFFGTLASTIASRRESTAIPT